jgi:predicted nucleotidyltransferase
MKKKLSRADIVDFLKTDKAYLSKEFGVVNIGLFGSYAKGSQNADSDVDILVELKEPRFEWLAGLSIYLEEKLGRRVELVRKSSVLRSRFFERVEKDTIYA